MFLIEFEQWDRIPGKEFYTIESFESEEEARAEFNKRIEETVFLFGERNENVELFQKSRNQSKMYFLNSETKIAFSAKCLTLSEVNPAIALGIRGY